VPSGEYDLYPSLSDISKRTNYNRFCDKSLYFPGGHRDYQTNTDLSKKVGYQIFPVRGICRGI
jgi:hypothetical protein